MYYNDRYTQRVNRARNVRVAAMMNIQDFVVNRKLYGLCRMMRDRTGNNNNLLSGTETLSAGKVFTTKNRVEKFLGPGKV